MNLRRITQPEIALILVPWFVTADQSRQEILCVLTDRLINKPDDTLVLAAVNGDKIKCFMAAFKDTDQDVYIWQARGSVGFKYGHAVLRIVEDWAKSKGCSRLTASTKIQGTRLRALLRKYRLRLSGDILIKEIA